MSRLWDATETERAETRVRLGEVARLDTEIARLQARRAEQLAGLARIALTQQRRYRPVATGVRRNGEAIMTRDDLPFRSMTAEVAAATRVTRFHAAADLDTAASLGHDFPRVHAAFAAGRIDQDRAWSLVAEGSRLTEVDDRALFEELALPHAVSETPRGTRQAAQRIASEIEAAPAAERHRRARAKRGVCVRDLDDGMAQLTLVNTAAVVHGMHDRITRMTRRITRDRRAAAAEITSAADGSDGGEQDGSTSGTSVADERTFDQVRADVATDLLLTGQPNAHHAYDPDGTDVLGALRGRVQVTLPVASLTGVDDQPAALTGHGAIPASVARRLAGAAAHWVRLFHRPDTGALLTVDRYAPTAAQRRLLVARDETCRFPGCRRSASGADIDHTHDHAAGGTTRIDNLAHLCRHHHVMKHHTAWTARQLGDGELEWTSPAGYRHRERPAPIVRFVDSERIARRRGPTPPEPSARTRTSAWDVDWSAEPDPDDELPPWMTGTASGSADAADGIMVPVASRVSAPDSVPDHAPKRAVLNV